MRKCVGRRSRIANEIVATGRFDSIRDLDHEIRVILISKWLFAVIPSIN